MGTCIKIQAKTFACKDVFAQNFKNAGATKSRGRDSAEFVKQTLCEYYIINRNKNTSENTAKEKNKIVADVYFFI